MFLFSSFVFDFIWSHTFQLIIWKSNLENYYNFGCKINTLHLKSNRKDFLITASSTAKTNNDVSFRFF